MKIPMMILPGWAGFKKSDQKKCSFNAASGPMEVSMWDGMNNYFVDNGIAMIPIFGAMMKNCGYPDQSELRALVARAAGDSSINGVMLIIDSPGGTVSGTEDLASAIEGLEKPCYSYIEDLGASAAYWTASASDKIFSNRAIVGSIGVISELVDASKYYKEQGIEIHQIVTGDFKGVGDESQPATPEKLDYLQHQIDAMGEVFFASVAKNRGMSAKSIRDMQAKVFLGQEAVDAGLVDKMCSFNEAMGALRKVANAGGIARKQKAMALVSSM